MPPHIKPDDENVVPLFGHPLDFVGAHQPADFIQPPQFVRPMTPDEIAAATRDPGMIEAIIERDFRETRHVEPYRREPLIDRIGNALSSPRFFIFYLGFYAGCITTVGLAYLWSLAL